jgi:hypothetical protein
MKFSYLIIGLLLSNLSLAQDWQMLFNGKDFSNFEQLNGKAKYDVIDGMMVGTATMGTPNSFMATKKSYGDFILEFEVKIENGMNSGVQFRSLSKADYNKGRVHGYQLEIETSDRRWAGGLYDESRRGWLYPLSLNKKGQTAFKNGDWNTMRVEAIGNQINSYVNGVHCVNLVDEMTKSGFIAFQVHSIGNEKEAGKQVKWRNIRILTENVDHYINPKDPEVEEVSFLDNKLTEMEMRRGWKLLWDGKSTKNWRGAKMDNFPEKGWKIQDGILKVLGADGGESANGGDIITKMTYSNFELQVDFKITKGANSGIKYFVDPELNKGEGSAIGLEFQILDDKEHPDGAKGKNGNRTVGSLYDLIRAGNLSEVSNNNKRFNGVGQWNRARIVSKNGHVQHWLNGVKVVEFDRHSQVFRALVEKSKYEQWSNFGAIPEGHILLQDHGDEVAFKNIKIREF